MTGRHIFILACVVFTGMYQHSWGQSLSRAEKRHKALNQYIDFTNESIHAIWNIHKELEKINLNANAYLATGEQRLAVFDIGPVISDFRLYSALKGVCQIPTGPLETLVDIQALYRETSVGNGYILEQHRIALNEHRDALMYNLIELLSVCDTIKRYTLSQKYIADSGLKKLYQLLERCAVLYNQFQSHKLQLEEVVSQVSYESPKGLYQLRAIVNYCRSLARSIKNEDSIIIRQHLQLLNKTIQEAEVSKVSNQLAMKELDLYYNRDNTGYTHLIDYAKQLSRRAEEFLLKPWSMPQYRPYGRTYYYYNERILALFNHHKYGITAYYNRFIEFANQVLVKELEEVPMYKVVYPEEGIFAENMLPPQEQPELSDVSPTLEGAAANNLIFLLDVSASMDRPEKLPLLKESMTRLVSLMRPEDHIAIIIYSRDAKTILNATSATFKIEIQEAIKALSTGGSTKARRGFKEAYRIAEKNFIPGGNNRIIMASDGAFDIRPSVTRMIHRKSQQQILLSVFLFNKLELQPVAEKLSELASLGGGNYAHVRYDNAYEVLVREAKAVMKRR